MENFLKQPTLDLLSEFDPTGANKQAILKRISEEFDKQAFYASLQLAVRQMNKELQERFPDVKKVVNPNSFASPMGLVESHIHIFSGSIHDRLYHNDKERSYEDKASTFLQELEEIKVKAVERVQKEIEQYKVVLKTMEEMVSNIWKEEEKLKLFLEAPLLKASRYFKIKLQPIITFDCSSRTPYEIVLQIELEENPVRTMTFVVAKVSYEDILVDGKKEEIRSDLVSKIDTLLKRQLKDKKEQLLQSLGIKVPKFMELEMEYNKQPIQISYPRNDRDRLRIKVFLNATLKDVEAVLNFGEIFQIYEREDFRMKRILRSFKWVDKVFPDAEKRRVMHYSIAESSISSSITPEEYHELISEINQGIIEVFILEKSHSLAQIPESEVNLKGEYFHRLTQSFVFEGHTYHVYQYKGTERRRKMKVFKDGKVFPKNSFLKVLRRRNRKKANGTLENESIPYETGRTPEGKILIKVDESELRVEEYNVEENKFLLFFVKDYRTFLETEEAGTMLLEVIRHYMEKTKTEGMKALILHYENLNNAIFPEISDLEKLGFSRHNHDDIENYAETTPEIFDAHLPRGFFLYKVKQTV